MELPVRARDSNAPTTRRVRGDGLDLAVYERGPAGAPTVVLVHGYPDDHTVWDGVAAELAERFHVVAYDVRGAGASDAPSGREGYRLEKLSADLLAVIDSTSGGRPAHVAAHDWGSIGAWEAVTDERAALRIASYTSMSGPCLDHVAHWARERRAAGDMGTLLGQIVRSWYVGLIQIPRLPEQIWRAGLTRAWPRMLAIAEGVRNAPRVHTADAVNGLEPYRANVPERLRAPRERPTNVPVHLLIPLRDRYVSPSLARSSAPWAPRLTVREIDGGHWVLRSAPRDIAARIAGFVDDIEGRTSAAG